jgi:hypothetical protein
MSMAIFTPKIVVMFIDFLVILDQKIEPMFFQRTCKSFYYLCNKNGREGRSMMHPRDEREINR